MKNQYFITAIGTDSGKTLISAIFVEAFKADYWKPVQAGFPTDSETISSLINQEYSQVLPEKIILKTPASPHAAAVIDQVVLKVSDFKLPDTSNHLIVEGAGGILVPLNDEETMGDLMKHLNLPVVLVSNLYLGSINHTLLSFEHLKRIGVNIAGIIFNGPPNIASESVIEKITKLRVLLRVKQEEKVDHEVVKKYAAILRNNLL